MKVYLAGPLFTQAERDFNEKLVVEMRSRGAEVFFPQEESAKVFGKDGWQDEIFITNVQGLKDADIVLAIIDGPIVDDGTSWEIGFAWTRGTPIYGLRTDFRTVGPEGMVNLMIERSLTKVFDDIDDVLETLFLYGLLRDGANSKNPEPS